jgi:hypothetical protein
MKFFINVVTVLAVCTALVLFSCCKKPKDPEVPEIPVEDPELITTLKIQLTDSLTGAVSAYSFKDPDGDGGQPAFYGPSAALQTDSVFILAPDRLFYVKILLLNESKNPVDTISKEVMNESREHMLFFNNGSNTIINSGNPYTVKLNGSDIVITYMDLDNGIPQRGVGLQAKWRTPLAKGNVKFPLNITLRHQPDAKNGTYAPGESDISVNFKLKVN